MGDKVNVLIDNLRSVLSRMMDLPTMFWVFLLLGFFFTTWILLIWFAKRRGQRRPGAGVMAILFAILSLFIISLQIDKRFSRQQMAMESLDRKLFKMNDELGNLEFRTRAQHDSTLSGGKMRFLKMDSFRHDWQRNYLVSERRINEFTELAILRIFEPQASAFIAAIDLESADLQIVLDDVIPEEKYLTSEFARGNDCFLAINGEAGKTPWQGSGFGEWIGNYISAGKEVLMEDTKYRPFMSFDKNNRARYYPELVIDSVNGPENYNTIFGRFDILLDGAVQSFENDLQYPRTIMALNETGTRLFLMVVDGSQPEYSMGLTYRYCADLLKYLGAYNAMACDQGGSSCMYIEQMGGIINRPRDGQERVVYTHFGLRDKRQQ